MLATNDMIPHNFVDQYSGYVSHDTYLMTVRLKTLRLRLERGEY